MPENPEKLMLPPDIAKALADLARASSKREVASVEVTFYDGTIKVDAERVDFPESTPQD